jgi:hypothetical protein
MMIFYSGTGGSPVLSIEMHGRAARATTLLR